jgi:hypothetical protein
MNIVEGLGCAFVLWRKEKDGKRKEINQGIKEMGQKEKDR